MAEQSHVRLSSPAHFQEIVQRLREDADSLHSALREQFGEQDISSSRAGEICDAIQRLSWSLERRPRRAKAAHSGG